MTGKYKVNVRGNRNFYFDTFDEAREYCDRVFQRNGLILSIVAC